MMDRFKLLTKIQLRNVFEERSTRKGKTSKHSRVLTSLILLAAMSVYFFALSRGEQSIRYYVTIFSMMVMVMGISLSQGILFTYKDGDLLRSMPFTDREIAASKLIVFLVTIYSYLLAILIPYLVIHGAAAGEGPLFYVLSVVGSLFVPMLPATIAALLGLWLTKISAGKKHEDTIRNGITFLAIFILCFASGFMSSGAELNFKNYLPSGLFASALLDGNMLYFLIFVAVNAAALIFFIFVFSGIMLRTGALTKQAYHEKNFKAARQEAKSPFGALRAKEFHSYFKNFLYVINTVIGMIILIIAAVVVLVMRATIAEELAAAGVDSSSIMTVITLVTGAMVGMSCTTAASISLEGKSLWILKSMPFTTGQIFLAKFIVNFAVTIIPGEAVALLMSIGFRASLASTLLAIVYILLVSVFTGLFGLLMNLRFPRLDFENEAQAIQQSVSSLIAVVVPLGINILLTVAYVYFDGWVYTLPAAAAAVAASDVIMFVLLKGWGVRRFAEL